MSERPMWYRPGIESTLAVNCPDCGVLAPNQCVYIAYAHESSGRYSQRVRDRKELIGTPTLRPHNGRFNAAYNLALSLRQHISYDRRVTRYRPHDPSRRRHVTAQMAIARAERQFDQNESTKLMLWLTRWGSIFTEETR